MKLISPSSRYKNIKDLSGKKFDKLTAIKINRVVKMVSYWDFQCDCGNSKTARGSHVSAGKIKTCGDCGATPEQEFFFKKDIYRNHLTSLKRRTSKNKLIENNLSFDNYVDICSKPCVYCGLMDVKKYSNGAVISFNGVDRIDSNIGYTLENSQPCCGRHNLAKRTFSHEDYIKDIKIQYEHLFGKRLEIK